MIMKIVGNAKANDILSELGSRIRRCRIDMGISQEELADRAFVSVGTIAHLENGAAVSTVVLVQVLKALGLGDNLEVLVPNQDVRPSDYIQYNKKAPRRVSRKQRNKPLNGWKWGDER